MTTTLIIIVAIIGFGLITGTITMVMIFKMLRNNKQKQHFEKGF